MTTKPTGKPEGSLPGAGGPNTRYSIFRRACPVCERPFSWLEKWRFAGWLGRRKEAPCPRCGTLLTWSKVPYLTREISACLCILVILVDFYATSSGWSPGGRFDIRPALDFGLLILAVVMLAASLRLRLIQRPEQR